MKGLRRPQRVRVLSDALPTVKPRSKSSDFTAEMSDACEERVWPSVSTQMTCLAGRNVKSSDDSGSRKKQYASLEPALSGGRAADTARPPRAAAGAAPLFPSSPPPWCLRLSSSVSAIVP